MWGGCASTCVHVNGRKEGDAENYLPLLSHLILLAKISQTNLELADMVRFASQLVLVISCFSFMRLESQTNYHVPSSAYRGSGDWNS